MGPPTLKYGESVVFLQHLKSSFWFSYQVNPSFSKPYSKFPISVLFQTSEVTKKGVGKVEEKKAIVLEEGHMDDCFTFNKAVDEESKSALVIRKCSAVLNKFLKLVKPGTVDTLF